MTSWPALSSDARLIAYVSDGGQDGTTPQIWVQQIGGAALRLTNGEREYSHLSFSPDDTANHVYRQRRFGPECVRGADARRRAAAPPARREPRRGCLPMAGGSRASRATPRESAIAARGGAGFRRSRLNWWMWRARPGCPTADRVVVHARPDPALEPDWWVVPIDGGSADEYGVRPTVPRGGAVHRAHRRGVGRTTHWCFRRPGLRGSVSTGSASRRPTFQPAGAPERLTAGSESAWLPSAAGGRLAFVSSRADANLWSVALDAASGIAHGPLRRMTRGPGILWAICRVTSDFRTLAYFSVSARTRRRYSCEIFAAVRSGSSPKDRRAEGVSGDLAEPATCSRTACRTAGGERALRPIVHRLPAPTGPGERWETIAAAGRASGWTNGG